MLAVAAAMMCYYPRSLAADLESARSQQQVDAIEVTGPINPASADFIADSIAHAQSEAAAALIIQIDTPGGLLSSARDIVKTLLNSPVPVIAYVAPAGASAASAGTFVVEAANVAAMAPGTTIGAAHPVEMGGGNIEGTLGQKMENFTASFAKTIAHQRGRNEAWMEEAVRKSSALDDREALRLHVIDLIAPNLPSLFKQITGRQLSLPGGRTVTLDLTGATINHRDMRLGENVLNRLADPNLMYLLMLAGLIGLYFEFAHPGVYLPGVIGAICLLLALASFEVIPINLAGFLLILLGAGLLISELFVTSYGVLGIGGVIAFVLGSLFLVDTSQTNLTVDRATIAGAMVAFSTIVLGLGYVVMRERRRPTMTGREGLIGEIGEVREAIQPGSPGRVLVHGELWRAVSETRLSPGTPVRVKAVDGLEIKVAGVESLSQ
ncbi:MAG: nodulation protein NfeD [Deltaproteobacteria bacterium]|nr:nodulation protein NfeD [Deltaproteobacteria bacterium]